ncbi:MAG: hypothetical protein ACP5D2_04590 [Candidatus Nanoarchaeia archaeon]
MAFEIMQKKISNRMKLPANKVRISKVSISFGSSFSKILHKPYLEVYLDRENKKLGFNPTDNYLTGFKMKEYKTSNTRAISGSWVLNLPMGIYDADIEDGMIVIKIPEVYI